MMGNITQENWQATVRKVLPKQVCTDFATPIQLWISLLDEFGEAIKADNLDLASKIVKLSILFLDSEDQSSDPSEDFYTAVVIGFLSRALELSGSGQAFAVALTRDQLINLKSVIASMPNTSKQYQIALSSARA